LFAFSLTPDLSAQSGYGHLSTEERYQLVKDHLDSSALLLRIDEEASKSSALKARKLSLYFDDEKVLLANIRLAQYYQQVAELDSALFILRTAIEEAKLIDDEAVLAEGYHALGLVYQFKGNFELAIDSYHKALEINERIGDRVQALRQYNNIGLVHRENREYDLALEYLEKCLSGSRKLGNVRFEFLSYGNIAYVLMEQNRWQEALERLEYTYAHRDGINDSIAMIALQYLLADAKLHVGNLEEAMGDANKALRDSRVHQYPLGIVYSLRVLGEIYLRKNRYGEARIYAQEAFNILEENEVYLYAEDVLSLLFEIEQKTGNYKKALEFQEQLFARRDSINTVQTQERIANSEFKFQIAQNKKENELLRLKNESTRRISTLAIAAALLLLALVIVGLVLYNRSRNYNATLEEAIQKRTNDLETTNKQLANSIEELERFAFVASHGLKTPLRNIVSFTGLLENRLGEHVEEEIKRYIQFIKDSGMRLNDLIIDTLEYSRLPYLAKESQAQVFDLKKLLLELVEGMSKDLEEKQAEVIVSIDLPPLHSVPASMILLFQNLVENGLKYNTATSPKIWIKSTKNQDGTISLFVKDNGIGIPPEYQDKVFSMYSRLHPNAEYEGSGLGLPICKKIVEQMGGRLNLMSQKGQGSTFEIRLPNSI
ncbi:MAG: ATP-binding protein, partial [Bacteroidota bacterium]